MLQLTERDGRLLLPSGRLLLVVYPAGDCDVLPWPRPASGYWEPAKWASAAHVALFDAREMGELPPDCREVLLPDGSTFAI